ncbi:MAG: ABC transporter permease subunit [Acidisphaera sp.]|nr:ABC transporter permease subunit [Acidisphaera sp.]
MTGPSQRMLRAGAVLAALALWYVVSAVPLVSADFLPGPGAVLATLVDILEHGYRGTTLAQDTFATLGRCLAGFALAIVTGVPLGLLMGLSRRVEAASNYIVQFMRPLPPLSYLILLILWLGTGNSSKVALLYLTAFPIVTSAAMAGVRGVKRQRIEAALSLGAGRAQILRYVVLPSALPTIFTGLRIALAAAFSTVVAAELMAASNGLGWMVFSASQFLRNDVIVLGILVLGALGMLLNWALVALDLRVVHWRGLD